MTSPISIEKKIACVYQFLTYGLFDLGFQAQKCYIDMTKRVDFFFFEIKLSLATVLNLRFTKLICVLSKGRGSFGEKNCLIPSGHGHQCDAT